MVCWRARWQRVLRPDFVALLIKVIHNKKPSTCRGFFLFQSKHSSSCALSFHTDAFGVAAARFARGAAAFLAAGFLAAFFAPASPFTPIFSNS